jgi:Peptidase family M28
MRTFIADVITQFGGRPAGTDAELGAQRFTRETLAAVCDATSLEPFITRLTSHFGILRPISALYLVALALFLVSPILAIAISAVNAAAFVTHFLAGRHWLDFLYPKGESWNVEGVVEPRHEVRTTLVVTGHIDSVYEFKWWYRLGHLGGALTVAAGFAVSLQWVALAAGLLVGPGPAQTGVLLLLLAEAPLLVVLFDMHDHSVRIDGASDNLTGVALAVELGRVFSAARLRHTRLRLVSFGAEEPYLRGSLAWATRHRDRLLAEHAVVINVDTIKDRKHLSIV